MDGLDERMEDWSWQKGQGDKGRGKGKEGMVSLEDKHFKGVEKFEGTGGTAGGDWGGWMFNLVTQMGGVSGMVAKGMEDILNDKNKEVSETRVEELVGKGAVDKYGGELFRLLCGLTKGEANTIVRGRPQWGWGEGETASWL